MTGTSTLGGSGWTANETPPTDFNYKGIGYQTGQPADGTGNTGDLSIDPDTFHVYQNTAGVWSDVTPAPASITLKNSAGTVTRTLSLVAGVATLVATDAIVANGASLVLQTSAGTTSAGNATLNSPAVATVAAGAVTAVKAAA